MLPGSAVISGIVSALIGMFNTLLKRAELRESRLAIAADLTRLNQERYIEAGRSSAAPADVTLQDPAQ